jgi:4-methyl-5(b-hydroxyethyl)-thiazole monophosphate biosynthesis
MMVLPGGVPGAPNLAENKALLDLLKKVSESGKYTAAVCAAPYALDRAGILDGKRVTIHPAWVEINYGAVTKRLF